MRGMRACYQWVLAFSGVKGSGGRGRYVIAGKCPRNDGRANLAFDGFITAKQVQFERVDVLGAVLDFMVLHTCL